MKILQKLKIKFLEKKTYIINCIRKQYVTFEIRVNVATIRSQKYNISHKKCHPNTHTSIFMRPTATAAA